MRIVGVCASLLLFATQATASPKVGDVLPPDDEVWCYKADDIRAVYRVIEKEGIDHAMGFFYGNKLGRGCGILENRNKKDKLQSLKVRSVEPLGVLNLERDGKTSFSIVAVKAKLPSKKRKKRKKKIFLLHFEFLDSKLKTQ